MSAPVDIVIPVYNEEEALPHLWAQLERLPFAFHAIFIDNCSTDNSLQFLLTLQNVTVVQHSENRGYGGSLLRGMAESTAEKVLIIDADGEYSPDVLPNVVTGLDTFEVVHTSRFLKTSQATMSNFKSTGNRIITSVFNFLFRRQLTDLYTGCKGYRRNCLTGLQLHRTGFEHVLEVSAKLVRQGVDIHEVPVCYTERTTGVSKMNHLLETVKYIVLVFYYWLTIPPQQPRQ